MDGLRDAGVLPEDDTTNVPVVTFRSAVGPAKRRCHHGAMLMCDHHVWVLSQAKQRPHVADEDIERLAPDLARQCPQCPRDPERSQ
jgi:hypothetical protein